MSLFNIYKTLCDGLGLAPVNGSYVQALGDYFGVVDQPNKNYEDEVLVAAISNQQTSDTVDFINITSNSITPSILWGYTDVPDNTFMTSTVQIIGVDTSSLSASTWNFTMAFKKIGGVISVISAANSIPAEYGTIGNISVLKQDDTFMSITGNGNFGQNIYWKGRVEKIIINL